MSSRSMWALTSAPECLIRNESQHDEPDEGREKPNTKTRHYEIPSVSSTPKLRVPKLVET